MSTLEAMIKLQGEIRAIRDAEEAGQKEHAKALRDVYILKQRLHEALEQLALDGWVPMGTHAGDDPVPRVEFSAVVDEGGLPVFERKITT